jgi:NAD(P) transhydrogenase
MSVSGYELVVIGSGPAGQKAAITVAKNHKRFAVMDRTTMIGGVCVHTGTIPSKAVREAIFQLTGPAVKALYGGRYNGSEDISIKQLSFRVKDIIARETQVIRAQLKRNGVAVYPGTAQFLAPHTLEIVSDGGSTKLEAEKILIACGTRQHTVRTFRSTITTSWIPTTSVVWTAFRERSSSQERA